MTYADRHLVVTGGTGALGTAVVGALLEAGATCHLPYHTQSEADRFPHRGHTNVTLAPLDLSDEAAVTAYYDGFSQLWASIHIAGGFAFAPIEKSDKALLMGQIESNLVSAYLCSRAAVAAFRKAGGGRIVNVAARPALEPRSGANMTAYTASKAGLAGLTMALAEEVARDGILVNAVAPSIMDTPANRKSMPKADFASWPKVEEVAATILFLASPENKVTRGAIVPVYGKA
jgi:NAD(P)-dependent dehydrogenase (short-subunit alcohol dehydrogenase family)